MFVFHLTTQEKVSKIQDTEGKRRNVDQYFEKKVNRKNIRTGEKMTMNFIRSFTLQDDNCDSQRRAIGIPKGK